MNKVFENEYKYIENKEYLHNLKILIELLPEYFFKVPASSTGKYHPSFSLNEGGLVRHTKAAVKIAYDLLNDDVIGNIFNQSEKDLMIISLILHDGLKHGLIESKYTVFEHPLLVSEFIKNNKEKLTLNDNDLEFITTTISSHMGPWNTNEYSDVILPLPKNKYQKFVHMCDYLSSRKYLDIKFMDNEILE
ncbi:MAG: hypothetical protein RR404_04215 [Bacilli bacterium]